MVSSTKTTKTADLPRKSKLMEPSSGGGGGGLVKLFKNCKCNPQTMSLERLFFAILMPFLVVLLLPSVQFVVEQRGEVASTRPITTTTTGELLLALLKLPLDRIKLQSAGGLIASAQAREISAKSDLQEEETHMLLLAPAEHRSSYAPAPTTYQYGSEPGGAQHDQPGASHQPQQPGDYGAQPPSGDETVGVAPAGSQQAVESAGAAGLAEAGSSGAGSTALQARSDLPAVRALNVKCEKNHMTVNIVFDRPFYGMVFSKGHYNDQKCVHLPPNSGQTSINFDIHLGKCGMSSSDATGAQQQLGAVQGSSNAMQQAQANGGSGQQPNGVYIENTIIIQYDPLVQEIFDQARKLRCTWYDYYEKSVSFRPYTVDMLDAVTANFLGDNIQCWMQIQVGKGPWSSEVAGIVKIGQTMTMVLAIKDDENRFDMLVRNCVAHDGKHQPIQLVDEYGCVARPKIMGRFQKVRNFGPAATVVSYAHFQAFKFPDSMSVHFQCVIQVCRYECPEPVCQAPNGQVTPAELSGPTSSNGQPPQSGGGGGDYATSGTEMIASKEAPMAGFYAGAAQPPPSSLPGYANHSHVNLKLDESQGRVQVKLDTSMMAGLNGRPPQTLVAAGANQQQQQAGPLPPHLLHMAAPLSGNAAPYRSGSQATIVSSGPATGGALVSRQHGQEATSARLKQAPTGGASSSNHHHHHPPLATHPAHIVHYSPQYGTSAASRRSAASVFTNRLGEMAPPELAPPYEADYNPALSLIGSPRGLKISATNTPTLLAANLFHQHHENLRLKRATSGAATARSTRHLSLGGKQAGGDSTSVQTQKSIQVVSPDDVAFSLLDPSEEFDYDQQQRSIKSQRAHPQQQQQQQQQSSVCFTTTRFLWGVLVTLGALVSSIVIVTYVILKQRSQLDQKLASVFVNPAQTQPPSSECAAFVTLHDSSAPSPALSDLSHHQQQQQLLQHNLRHQQILAPHQQRGLKSDQEHHSMRSHNHLEQQHERRQRRQQEELQQRHNYLSRLYSQFAPASYWR